MKSVGEAMAFGRTFAEAFQKALCSLELDSAGFDRQALVKDLGKGELLDACRTPSPTRIWYVAEALRAGHSIEALYKTTAIDPWFLTEIQSLIRTEEALRKSSLASFTKDSLLALKRDGFSDERLAALLSVKEEEVRNLRVKLGVRPSYKSVDTCAAEFRAFTPYLYSSYDEESEAPAKSGKKVIILGSGPNRIGQGIEFDYCCVHAVFAAREEGYEAIMLNCNPETVSTDYDISDKLYFEPLSLESVLEVVRREKPDGVIVQFGGQTPLKLAAELEALGAPIIGTSVDSIDIAEDRERFTKLVQKLNLRQPDHCAARSEAEAFEGAHRIGYPVMIRPSFVLGGRAMRVVHQDSELREYLSESVRVSNSRPVLIDRYLHNAIEVDVDAVCDGTDVVIAGLMEHIERAGVHSGDSSFCLPAQTLSPAVVTELKRQTKMLALELKVVGLINVQFAVTPDQLIYILEANPRASRTVPFVGKAYGIPWARIAAKVMLGRTLKDLGATEAPELPFVTVKTSVFPFKKFPGVDTILGPEMKSTGEVMGIHRDFAGSFAKAQAAAGIQLPLSGTVFLSVKDGDKQGAVMVARQLAQSGFKLAATGGTAKALSEQGIAVETVRKVREGSPHVVDLIGQKEVQLIINTPEGSGTLLDSRSIRLMANEMNVSTYTTIAAAQAAASSIASMQRGSWIEVCPLQDYHTAMRKKKVLKELLETEQEGGEVGHSRTVSSQGAEELL